jgi:hypothetical protein
MASKNAHLKKKHKKILTLNDWWAIGGGIPECRVVEKEVRLIINLYSTMFLIFISFYSTFLGSPKRPKQHQHENVLKSSPKRMLTMLKL